MEEKAFPPLHRTVCKTVVGQQLVAPVHSSHECVVLVNTVRLSWKPPTASRVLLLFDTTEWSWTVVSTLTSRLSFHFRASMPSCLPCTTSPFLMLFFVSFGRPFLLDRTVPHAPNPADRKLLNKGMLLYKLSM